MENRIDKSFDIGKYFQKGREVEGIYADTAISYGYEVGQANVRQDMYEHWDCWIRKSGKVFKVEVKGMKKLMRKNKHPQDEWLWIELRGKWSKGWLYGGKADVLAFETQYGFVMVRRTDLINLVNELVEWDKLAKVPYMAYYSVYRREGGIEQATLISMDELRSLRYKYWHKPEESIHPW